MAEVYLVQALHGKWAGRQLALKRLLPSLRNDEESVRRFTSEAELSRHLKHHNIVEVLDVGSEKDSIYMVMEFIDGRDVAQIIRRCKEKKVFWPSDFAVCLTRGLLDALAYAHQAKSAQGKPLDIVHCDVSPSNFFVSRDGELKLGDFGVARSLLEGNETMLGKTFYLSPEAIQGHLTPAVDLWAAAVTLYELLTLQRPFSGETPEEAFEAIAHSRYTPILELRPDLSPKLAGVVARALDEDVNLRYATAAEFAFSLQAHTDERVGTPLAISAMVRGLFGSMG
jgi:eukaryotic-like serine/threonine-protein kinase